MNRVSYNTLTGLKRTSGGERFEELTAYKGDYFFPKTMFAVIQGKTLPAVVLVLFSQSAVGVSTLTVHQGGPPDGGGLFTNGTPLPLSLNTLPL